MGKKKGGGNRHKKQGRKHINQTAHKEKLTVAHEEDEQYAKIIKINGGGTADVLCNDGITRLLVIRKKFRGRNKRDNEIKLHTVILVGLRSWEVVAPKKKQKVDLLYVYSNNHLLELSKLAHLSQRILPDEYRRTTTDNDAYETGNTTGYADHSSSEPIRAEENTKIVLDNNTEWDDI